MIARGNAVGTFGLVFFAGVCAFALASPNPVLSLASLGCLALIVVLMWREAEAPVFLFVLLYHWIQSSIAVFYANVCYVKIDEVWSTPRFDDALLLSVAACVILAIGIRCSISGLSMDRGRILQELRLISFERVLVVYTALIVFSLVARIAYGVVPGLRQPLLAVCSLRWGAFFLLALVAPANSRNRQLFFVVLVLEVIVGATGYFSTFKIPLFVLIIAAITNSRRFSPRQLFGVSCVGTIILLLGLLWLAVRDDYREVLNAGTGQQVVKIPISERLLVLGELLTSVNGDDLNRAGHTMAKRVQYVDYFAACLNRVPSVVPHTYGRFHWETVQHVLMPRVLFPDKAEQVDESARTMLYTGKRLAGRKQGTSISIGYFGQLYVEFGYFMLVAVFFYGLFWGALYKVLIRICPLQSVGLSAVVALFISIYHIEFSITQLFGGTMMRFLVSFTILYFLGERTCQYLVKGRVPGGIGNSKSLSRERCATRKLPKFVKKS